MFGKGEGEGGLLSSFGAEADAERRAAAQDAEFEGGFFEGTVVCAETSPVMSRNVFVSSATERVLPLRAVVPLFFLSFCCCHPMVFPLATVGLCTRRMSFRAALFWVELAFAHVKLAAQLSFLHMTTE